MIASTIHRGVFATACGIALALVTGVVLALAPEDGIDDEALTTEQLFSDLKPALFTVESVDIGSGNKQSQGSGFLVGADGRIATNYHVIEEHVQHPDRSLLRFRDHQGGTGRLEVLAVDVIHDLSLLRMVPEDLPENLPEPFALADQPPPQGAELIALGNPYDLGISLVPGTYNGLLDGYYKPAIHFTGALNPGMSGGPTVDRQGRVVGINVAGMGNSVSFLVPVSFLAELIGNAPEEPPPPERLRDGLAGIIAAHQSRMLDELIAGDWSLEPFGPLMIPRQVQPWVNCTGGSTDPGLDAPWESSSSDCKVNDRIYLSRSLDTGPLEMMFIWQRSEQLNAFQFSRAFEQSNFSPYNRAGEGDTTDFECLEDWVQIPSLPDRPFKASWCARGYIDYPGIYDVLYVARIQRPGPEGLFLHYTLSGVSRKDAERFHRHFLEHLRWK
ncbi:MAG: hypothetical protein Kow0020_08200 [Wenzhouxiangellaceae bacterium]